MAWFWQTAPGAVWYWVPLFAGLVGSIPFAMVTAHPGFGRALTGLGLCRIPEESGLSAWAAPATRFRSYSTAPQAAE